MSTRGDLNRINEGATFTAQHPPTEEEGHDGTRPCLTVAGVQVYAYVEVLDLGDGPTLVVSVDYDTAGESFDASEGEVSDGVVLGWLCPCGCGQAQKNGVELGIPTEVRIGPSLRVQLSRTGAVAFTAEP